MRFFDLLSLILENLGRRKGRVALTAIGVVIGTSAVVILVSLGIGLQRSATSNLRGISDLTRIDVSPNYEMMEAVAISSQGIGKPGQPPQVKLITDQTLEEIRAIPGVTHVIARDWVYSSTILNYGKLESWVGVSGVDTDNLENLNVKLQSGTTQLDRGTAVIGKAMLQSFMDPRARPGQEPPEPPDLQDQQVRMTIMRYSTDGTETRRSFNVRIVGVSAECFCENDWTLYMTLDDVETYNQWVNGRRINRNRDGYQNITVKAADVDQVLGITDQISAMGYMATAQQDFVQGISSFFVILQVAFGGVGAVALLVAAIGIANTMTMAILERTREIGLMKAVGATNNNVLAVFLGEAAGIGLIGGLGGVAIGWAGGQILDIVALSYMTGQMTQSYGPPPSLSIYTPLWLPAFALGFATLVGLVSGLYPALRAATLIPVNALKYE